MQIIINNVLIGLSTYVSTCLFTEFINIIKFIRNRYESLLELLRETSDCPYWREFILF